MHSQEGDWNVKVFKAQPSMNLLFFVELFPEYNLSPWAERLYFSTCFLTKILKHWLILPMGPRVS